MNNNTTEQQLTELRKEVAKILSNQSKLEGLIYIIGRHIYGEGSGDVKLFDTLAKSWDIKS